MNVVLFEDVAPSASGGPSVSPNELIGRALAESIAAKLTTLLPATTARSPSTASNVIIHQLQCHQLSFFSEVPPQIQRVSPDITRNPGLLTFGLPAFQESGLALNSEPAIPGELKLWKPFRQKGMKLSSLLLISLPVELWTAHLTAHLLKLTEVHCTTSGQILLN